jgi:hypothetical protein
MFGKREGEREREKHADAGPEPAECRRQGASNETADDIRGD